MKRLFLSLCLVPMLASAKSVSFEFRQVSLLAFSQAVFKSMLGRDFVMSPEALAADKKVTMSVKGMDSDAVPRFVEDLLAQQGIVVTVKDGVYYLNVSHQSFAQAANGSFADSLRGGATAAPATVAGASTDRSEQADRLDRGRSTDDETVVYLSNNRPSDFLAAVVNAAFGGKAVQVAGSRLVLTGSKDDLKKMAALLESLDALPAKVDVSASWIEVTRSDGTNGGISLLANVLGARLGLQIGSVGTSVVSLKNANFDLVIDALRSDGRFNQVSNSRVVGDEYAHVMLTVGDETPTVSSTGKDNAGNQVQNIVYRPSGVIVDVVPKVLASKRINMVIDGQISNFKPTLTGVSLSPTLVKRQVKTDVTIADGEVLLIGGLNDSTVTESSSGFSFLPASWSLKSNRNAQTDLVLILSASLAK